MSQKGRRWFLIWGLLFAVVVVRGLLPWLIVWLTAPSLGPMGALTATMTNHTFNTDGSIFYPDTREFFDECRARLSAAP